VDYLFHGELYETVMFRSFNGADSAVQIMFCQTRNYSVIVSTSTELIIKSVVVNTYYGISMHVQRKSI
jgi:hypothetical protein